MRWFFPFLTSSIGKKLQVAAAGLLLCVFLVSHLAGNLLLYFGPETFNLYAEKLAKNIFLPIAEVGLLALFLLHIASALWVRYEDIKARPVPYQSYRSLGGRSLGSRTMAASGILLLAFLIVHVKTFRFTPNENLYYHVIGSFRSVPYALFYLAAMAALGLHLSHGVQSAFRTFGVEHPKYTPAIERAGWAFAGVIAAGFASIVVWAGWFAARSCCQ